MFLFITPIISAQSIVDNNQQSIENKLAKLEKTSPQQLDSAIEEWKKIYDSEFQQLSLANKAELLIIGSNMYLARGELAQGEIIYKQLTRLLTKITDLTLKAHATILEAKIAMDKGNSYKALDILTSLNLSISSADNTQLSFQYFSTIAFLHYRMAEYQLALSHYLKASELIPLMLKADQSYNVMELYNMLGLINLDIGKNEKGLNYIEKAIKLAQENGNNEMLAHLYINRGVYYRNTGDIDGWYKNTLSAYNLGVKIDYPIVELTALTNLTDYLIVSEQYKEAQESALLAIAKARQLNAKREEAMSIGNLGMSLFLQGLKNEGIIKVEEAIAIVKEIEFRQMESMMLNSLVDMYADIGNYKKAYNLLREQNLLENELFNKEREKALASMQNKLDLNEKDRINELLKRDLQLKNERLVSQELEQLLMLSLASIAIMALILILIFAMKIKEKNRKLSVKNSQLKLDSQKDPLTGLSNRRGFESFITRYNFAEENIPSTKHSDAILIMDIDHFKSVNDTYGHSAGDYVLKEIARILTMNIRDNEIVVRWGGEEFLMYFRDLNKQHISKVVNRLLKHISQSKFQFEQQTLNVTMSIGFIYSPFNDITGEKLDWEACIKLADEALYLSKHSGRNRATGVIESNDVTNNELRHTPLTDLVATNKINIIEITNKND